MEPIIGEPLLSKILHVTVTRVFVHKGRWKMEIIDTKDSKQYKFVSLLPNLYQLAAMCKNFAYRKGYRITEKEFSIKITCLTTGESKFFKYTKDEQKAGIVCRPEYVFKACNWIVEKETQ